MIEAMKQALEALSDFDYDKRMAAITALRQAIAEAEKQETVIDKSAAIRIATALGWEPKREWVGLTDEDYFQKNGTEEFEEGAMWAEAKLKDKNQ